MIYSALIFVFALYPVTRGLDCRAVRGAVVAAGWGCLVYWACSQRSRQPPNSGTRLNSRAARPATTSSSNISAASLTSFHVSTAGQGYGIVLERGTAVLAPRFRIMAQFIAAWSAAGAHQKWQFSEQGKHWKHPRSGAYFSPRAESFARTILGSAATTRPARRGLSLAAGDQRCWLCSSPKKPAGTKKGRCLRPLPPRFRHAVRFKESCG